MKPARSHVRQLQLELAKARIELAKAQEEVGLMREANRTGIVNDHDQLMRWLDMLISKVSVVE